MIKEAVLKIIAIYQRTLSPDHGPLRIMFPYGYCRFYPSCSEYIRKAVFEKGALKGIVLGLFRLLKCNPYHKPEWNPVSTSAKKEIVKHNS